MIAGARQGRSNRLRSLAAAMLARELHAVAVPGPDVFSALGLDPSTIGVTYAATPRHANLLLLAGPLPPELREAAAVAYAQMPRPRVILALGSQGLSPLPDPDVTGPASREGLVAGVRRVRELLAHGAFAPEARSFEAALLASRTEYTCPMHPEIVQDEPGTCPKCGMDLVPREAAGPHGDTHHSHQPSSKRPEHHQHHDHQHHDHQHDDHQHHNQDRHDHDVRHDDADDPTEAGDTEAGTTYTCPMHPEIVRDEPGRCPKCGMFLVPQEAAGATHDPGQDQDHPPDHEAQADDPTEAGDTEAGTTYTCPMHPEVVRDEPGRCPKCGMFLVPAGNDDAGTGHDAGHAHSHAESHLHDHGTDDGEAHSHGAGMDFMSMVEVTKDLPRGRDGLPMDRIDVPFGPLFPGLPGGLALTLTLAGDAVVRASARTVTGPRNTLPEPGMPAARFIEHLGSLDPLAPVAYRLLALCALESASGSTPGAGEQRARVAAAERERAASHLGWLAQLARQVGLPWLQRRATRLQLTLIKTELDALAPLGRQVEALRKRLEHTPLLAARLTRVGTLPSGDALRGPVARATGMNTDARTHDPTYAELGFEPVLQDQGDALARLRVRLEETTRSLQLVQAAGSATPAGIVDGEAATSEGQAAIETPRGEARLHLRLDNGLVTEARLDTPSARHLALLPELLADLEVGDALVATGSLDISPWEASAS